MSEKKPRIPHVGLDFGKPAIITGIQTNADGSLTFLGAAGERLSLPAGFDGLAYTRTKGHKTTVQVPQIGESVGSLPATLARFDLIIGVDTNSRVHDGEVVCAAAICELTTLKYERQSWSAKVDPLWALEFRNPSKDAERIGWRHTLAHGAELGWLSNDRKILLVTDCHLGQHHTINTRATSLIDDFFLPAHVSIAYASSDAAADSPLNGLIAHCDRIARAVLDEAILCAPNSTLIQAPNTPFRAHRYWRIVDGV